MQLLPGLRDDPNTMIVRADAYAVTDNDSISKLTGAMVFFRVEGVKLAKASSVSAEQKNSEIDTRADKDKGETGVSIPEALAIVIIGGAAAMAGAGAGGGGGDGGDNNSKRRSRYKMCLRKDFGDGIRYDTQPVTVYARIVELTPEGEEIDRPDLTSAIEIFFRRKFSCGRLFHGRELYGRSCFSKVSIRQGKSWHRSS